MCVGGGGGESKGKEEERGRKRGVRDLENMIGKSGNEIEYTYQHSLKYSLFIWSKCLEMG